MDANEAFGIAFLVGSGIILIVATSHWIIGLLCIAWAIAGFLGNIQDIGNDNLIQ